MSTDANQAATDNGSAQNKFLFWACFISLIATAFGFIVRIQVIDEWAIQFNLNETQKGEIFGVGLWPFAISIILFSLVIDKVGYGRAMVFAFFSHIAYAIITICAPMVLAPEGASAEAVAAGQSKGYWMLYFGNFIFALGNGTVEAVINPVVATLFSKDKTKWLNILHAGWPGGLVLAGILALFLGAEVHWQYKVALIFIPAIAYGLMMLKCKFPVNERVAAGVSYLDMLKEAGAIGALIVVFLVVREIGRVFAWSNTAQIIIGAVLVVGYGLYVKSLGRPMFILLLLIMIPLATTELGVDSWITALMEPEMKKLGLQAGWVLVYTSFIMMVLRFYAGPIVHKLSPLGLLVVCSILAAVGLVFLSKAAGMAILIAATLYGIGKTFFWPTMLGVVSEQFPKGGALTLNAIAGVGMLGAGIVGGPLLGNLQDKTIDKELLKANPAIHAQVIGEEKLSVFGKYQPIDNDKLAAASDDDKAVIKGVQDGAKKNALYQVAIFPIVMLVGYILMILYFKSRGGYKPVDIGSAGH